MIIQLSTIRCWQDVLSKRYAQSIFFLHVQFLHEEFGIVVVVAVLVELESLTVVFPHVLQQHQIQQVFLEGLQLEVTPSVVVRQDRNPILRLSRVAVCSVVHQNHVAQVPVYHPQVLRVHPLRSLITVLAEQPMLDVLVVGVQIIQDHIGVARVTSSEDDDLEVFAEVFEDVLGMGPDVDACFYDFASGESDGEFDVVGGREGVVAVNEGFVEVEHHCLFAYFTQQLPSYSGFFDSLTCFFLISQSVANLEFSRVLKMWREVRRCSLARLLSSLQLLMISEMQQMLCLGEQGFLSKVWSSECSGMELTNCFKSAVWEWDSSSSLALLSASLCFYLCLLASTSSCFSSRFF